MKQATRRGDIRLAAVFILALVFGYVWGWNSKMDVIVDSRDGEVYAEGMLRGYDHCAAQTWEVGRE